MKTCTGCRVEKPVSDFNAKKKALQATCKQCQSVYYKNYYKTVPKEKARLLKNNAKALSAMKAFIVQVKSVPCTDCGVQFHHAAMDFDHLPGTEKKFDLAVAGTRGRQSILAEIKKCQVVCACCHRVRTYNRLHSIPVKPNWIGA